MSFHKIGYVGIEKIIYIAKVINKKILLIAWKKVVIHIIFYLSCFSIYS